MEQSTYTLESKFCTPTSLCFKQEDKAYEMVKAIGKKLQIKYIYEMTAFRDCLALCYTMPRDGEKNYSFYYILRIKPETKGRIAIGIFT